MKKLKIADEMQDELKVYLLALNQLCERRAKETAEEKAEIREAEKEKRPVNPKYIGKYERHYLGIEYFIMKQLKAWRFPLKRAG